MNPVLVSIQAEPLGPARVEPFSWTATPGHTPWKVARMGAVDPRGMRLRVVISTTSTVPAACLAAASAESGNSPSSANPATLEARAFLAAEATSPEGVSTASVTSPRASAAAVNSGV